MTLGSFGWHLWKRGIVVVWASGLVLDVVVSTAVVGIGHWLRFSRRWKEVVVGRLPAGVAFSDR